jgi:hypothetical protein
LGIFARGPRYSEEILSPEQPVAIAIRINSLMNLWVPLVPVCVLLKCSRSLEDRDVVARPGDELQARRKILLREAAGHGKRRQAAKIADGA